MINKYNVKRYCNEDISLIENYDKAINDETQLWDCHHRKETDEGLSVKQLKELGLYYNRPTSELIFLTHSEHASLHNKSVNNAMYGIKRSEKTKRKISESKKGKSRTTPIWNKGLPAWNKGLSCSEEQKQKTSETISGKYKVTNGIENIYIKPEELNYYLTNGYKRGFTKNLYKNKSRNNTNI